MGGDSQMITHRSHRGEFVSCRQREQSGTQPPSLLIDKFMCVGDRKWLLVGFQCHPFLLLSHFCNCQKQNKITSRQWIIRKFMKRDECDGTLHNISMRKAPRRSKCYSLISTVTLYYSVYSTEGHIMDRVETHTIMWWYSQSQLWDVIKEMNGHMQMACLHIHHPSREQEGRKPHLCAATAYIFHHSGGQWKCVHDSYSCHLVCEWVNFDMNANQRI